MKRFLIPLLLLVTLSVPAVAANFSSAPLTNTMKTNDLIVVSVYNGLLNGVPIYSSREVTAYDLVANIITFGNFPGGGSFVNKFNNRSGNVTLGSGDVTGALGYTPLDAAGGPFATVAFVGVTSNALWQMIQGNTAGVFSFNGRQGVVTLVSADVTGALGYTPFNLANANNGAYANTNWFIATNDSRNMVLTSLTNNLGTNVSAGKFWGDGSGLFGLILGAGSSQTIDTLDANYIFAHLQLTVTNTFTVYSDTAHTNALNFIGGKLFMTNANGSIVSTPVSGSTTNSGPIQASGFYGPLAGNVTGNVSGSAGRPALISNPAVAVLGIDGAQNFTITSVTPAIMGALANTDDNGTNETFWGTSYHTNKTWTDGSGWHQTNSTAASQGVQIQRGNVIADGNVSAAGITNTGVLGASALATDANGKIIAGSGGSGGGGTNAATTVLSFGATVATDMTTPLGAITNGIRKFRLTATGNFTLSNPTGITASNDGMQAIWTIIQDGTGGRLITMDTKFAFGSDITAITLTTTAGKRDAFAAFYDASIDKWIVSGFTRGY